MTAAVEVHQLVREFRGGIRAVDGLDLEVRDGEIYGFLGPNGAGKTTTISMLCTLLNPTSGTATVNGFDVVRRRGRPLSELDRKAKQEVVRILEGRGAFSVRHGVETVAGALGVSRFTVYNYLNRENAAKAD